MGGLIERYLPANAWVTSKLLTGSETLNKEAPANNLRQIYFLCFLYLTLL